MLQEANSLPMHSARSNRHSQSSQQQHPCTRLFTHSVTAFARSKTRLRRTSPHLTQHCRHVECICRHNRPVEAVTCGDPALASRYFRFTVLLSPPLHSGGIEHTALIIDREPQRSRRRVLIHDTRDIRRWKASSRPIYPDLLKQPPVDDNQSRASRHPQGVVRWRPPQHREVLGKLRFP